MNFLGFNGIMLSAVHDVPLDSEVNPGIVFLVVRDVPFDNEFIWMSVCCRVLYCVILKRKEEEVKN